MGRPPCVATLRTCWRTRSKATPNHRPAGTVAGPEHRFASRRPLRQHGSQSRSTVRPPMRTLAIGRSDPNHCDAIDVRIPEAHRHRGIRTINTRVRRHPGDSRRGAVARALRIRQGARRCTSSADCVASGARSPSIDSMDRQSSPARNCDFGAFDTACSTARRSLRCIGIEYFAASSLVTKRVTEIDRDFAIVLHDRIQSNLCVPPQDSVEISTGIASPWGLPRNLQRNDMTMSASKVASRSGSVTGEHAVV